jgi:hypothetical protein
MLGTGITEEEQLGASKTQARSLLTKIEQPKSIHCFDTFHQTN